MSQPSPDDLRALEALLADHFDGDGLRRFATRWYGRTVMMRLGGSASPGAAVVHHLVQMLVRRGEVEALLFGAIIAERPESESQARALAARFGVGRVPVLAQQWAAVAASDVPAAVVDEVYARLLDERDGVDSLFSKPQSEEWERVKAALKEVDSDPGIVARVFEAGLQRAQRRAFRQVVKEAYGAPEQLRLVGGLVDRELARQAIDDVFFSLLERLAPYAGASEGALWIEAQNIARAQLADRR